MERRFGVYVHWPFCASKCPYCDFNSHVRQDVDHDAWRSAFQKEIEYYAGLTPGRVVTSIFFGGGTPSLMQPETIRVVTDSIAKHWVLAPEAEITLEANPTSIEADKFTAFRAAGINRVSVGVQSLNDDELRFLGREHSAKEAQQAIEIAAKTFDRYSFDLIYARPNQSITKWRQELETALKMADRHLSLYQLTIEQGTPFYTQHKRGDFAVPDDDAGGALYEVTQEIMEQAGMPAYEISNHAAPGQESAHNMTYWRYDDYVGIGPGAHGRLTLNGEKYATRGHRAPEIWMERVQEKSHGAHPFEAIDPRQRFTEALMMGLRLREGVSLPFLVQDTGGTWQDYLDQDKVKTLVTEALLEHSNDNLRATAAGRQRLNGVLGYLL